MAAPSFGVIDLNVGLSSKDLRDLESAASDIESGLSSFVKSATKVGFDKRAIRGIEKMGENVAESFKKGMADAQNIQAAMAKMEVENAKALAKMGAGAAKNAEIARQKALMQEQKADWHGIQKNLAALEGGLQERIKDQDKALERQTKYMEKSWKETAKSAGKEVADEFGDALKGGSVDLKSLGGKLAKGMQHGLGKAGASAKSAGAGMEAGKMASAMGAMGGAMAGMAAAVGVIAAVVAILFAADAQAKDFNKTILASAGAADLAYGSGTLGSVKEMETRLNDLRQAAVNVAGATRESTKDILASMAAANEAGLQYSEMTKFVDGAATSLEAYQSFATVAVRQARMLGVSVSTISEQMATWSEDLGGSLDDMEKSFTMITKAAMQSGFGTKRLFTAVSQATSGTQLYNSSLNETIALMGNLSKSLGKSGATEFVKALQKGFATEGYQDRFKKLMIAGSGDMAEIMRTSATSTVETFQTKFGDQMKNLDLSGTSAENAIDLDVFGVGGDVGKGIDQMAKMSEKQLRSLLTQAEQSSPEMAQQLQTIARLSKGTQKSISEQAKGLDALGVGGVLATQITGGLGGKAISEMSALELAAFEQYAGVSGEALVQLRRVDASIRGEHERLKEIKAAFEKAGPNERKALKEEFQKLGGVVDKNGSLADVGTLTKHIMSQEDRLAAAVDVGMDEQTAISDGIGKNTIGIQAVLENTIVGLLQSLQYINQGIWDATLGLDENFKKAKRDSLEGLEGNLTGYRESLVEKEGAVGAAEKKVKTSQGGDEREAAEAELAAAKLEVRAQKALIAKKEKEAAGVRASSSEGLGYLQTGALYGSQTGEMAENAFQGFMGMTNAVGGVALSAAGVDDETIAGGAALSQEMVEQTFDPAALAASYMGVGDSFAAGMEGKSEEQQAADALLATVTGDARVALKKQLDAQKLAREETEDAGKGVEGSVDDLNKEMPDNFAEGQRKAAAEDAVEAGGLTRGTKDFDAATEALMGGGKTALKMKDKLAANYGKSGGKIDSAERAVAERAGIALPEAQDFIWRAGQGISAISSRDDVLGAKPGGPVDKAGGGGGKGGGNTVNVYGGDTKKLYATLKEWGVV